MGNTMRIGFALSNFKELQAMLTNLPAKTEQNVIGVALEAAAKPIVAAAKRIAPKETGALRKSITHALRKYPKKTMVIIGPDRNYYEGGKKVKPGQWRKGQDRPANYAHLVEFGHVKVARKKGTSRRKGTAQEIGFVAARPFLRPAVWQNEKAAAQAFEIGVTKGLEREIKKMNRKIIQQRGQAA